MTQESGHEGEGSSRSPFKPPERLVAEMFIREMGSGRNKAVALHAARQSGDWVEVIVKLAARLDAAQAPMLYLLEWLASALALRLGLHTPTPYQVEITKEFADSLPEPLRSVAIKSQGVVFGSEFCPGPFSEWPAQQGLSKNLRLQAADVFAFDVFIQNIDRRVKNPNLFLDRERILVYDHDLTFSFALGVLLLSDPAEDPFPFPYRDHFFGETLRGRMPSLQEFKTKIKGVTDPEFSTLSAATPKDWTSGQCGGKLTEIIDVMRRRRNAVDRWLLQVEAWK